MSKKEIEIYTIHSKKGGVGKTSVAVAIAGWSSIKNKKKTLIIDGDVTRTSLIDLWGNEETKEKPHYFNELLLSDPLVFKEYRDDDQRNQKNVEDFCLSAEDFKDIYYIPSSPILNDVKVIVSLISQEDKLHFFQSRMKDIIEILVEKGFEVIIIDNPPGLYGMSKAMLEIRLEETVKFKYVQKVFFVTTSDTVDYLTLIPSFSKYWKKRMKERTDEEEGKKEKTVKELKLLLNKYSIHESRDPIFHWEKMLKNLELLPKDRKFDKEILTTIKDACSNKEVPWPSAAFVDEFSMKEIFSIIESLSTDKETAKGAFAEWCKVTGQILGIEIKDGILMDPNMKIAYPDKKNA